MNSQNKRLAARATVFASAKQSDKADYSTGSMRNLLFGVLTISTVLGCLPKTAHAASLQFDEIYVFGDSLSDVGNAFSATGSLIPPSPPYFEGRFSNGPVWVENLAAKLGVTFNEDPTLDTNFAFGGATTGTDNTIFDPLGIFDLPGLQEQIDLFKVANPSPDPNGLYIVWAGANDYFGGGATSPTVPVKNLSTAVTSLAELGAKNFMVVNLPNLGELPQTRESEDSDALNALTEAHNRRLDRKLISLIQTLGPDINVVRFDVNSQFDAAITNPGQFDLTNVTDSCLAENFLDICDNPNEYLFWDAFNNVSHPTARGHEIIAESAFSVLKNPEPIPEPASTLGIFTFGALGAGWLLKRKPMKQKI